MDYNYDSDSDYVTDESSSLSEEDYKIYKQVEVDQIKKKHQNEIVILISNDKKNQDLRYHAEKIRDVVFKIIDDNVSDEYYCKLISSFKNIRSIKFERDLQFLTCTKSIQLAYNMLRCINLSQIQEINLSLPIKEKYTEQFSTEQQQNVVWDGDDDIMQEEGDKNKKKSNSKKNKEQQLIEKEKMVRANKYELFQNILKLIQSSCFQLKELTLIMNSWYSDDSATNNFQNVFDLLEAILKNNANSIQAFHLNAFQWGFYNRNFTSNNFDQIVEALMKINPQNFQELTLDFGRWGCEEYKNYKIFKDQSVIQLSQALSNFKNLTYLQLNFRSWAYDNESITDLSILSLFNSIQCLQKLIVLNIEVSRWKYQNKCITIQSIKQIGATLLCLKKLKLLALSLKTSISQLYSFHLSGENQKQSLKTTITTVWHHNLQKLRIFKPKKQQTIKNYCIHLKQFRNSTLNNFVKKSYGILHLYVLTLIINSQKNKQKNVCLLKMQILIGAGFDLSILKLGVSLLNQLQVCNKKNEQTLYLYKDSLKILSVSLYSYVQFKQLQTYFTNICKNYQQLITNFQDYLNQIKLVSDSSKIFD
ncbi:hypothetical protein TTHERM_00947490 (macronuclear) [Tetrahymena thermophila SB210]|uniref:Uncharacterized protein n=1 Tax=Tetrahymena thermophila (strain SB210) TaxID=312017 RepID=I7MF75_TETTS|nr:hypothetical protein TTHERM_00947490 [Tetrahymena thermophila SB210]EAR83322.2 hypothetical protein TTHERM_00947490 [Tetrahymena thermophila SB210]|eukprot:XP_001030985.2 hypothetical protein TTHERM_00947490 [Tetrahymena thermophila SB210]